MAWIETLYTSSVKKSVDVKDDDDDGDDDDDDGENDDNYDDDDNIYGDARFVYSTGFIIALKPPNV